MSNAFIGYPVPYVIYTLGNCTAAPGTDVGFMANDEPGLVFTPVLNSNPTIEYFDIWLDVGQLLPRDFPTAISILGLGELAYTISMFASNDHQFGGAASNPTSSWSERSNFSGYRSVSGSNAMKFFSRIPLEAQGKRYYLIRVPKIAAQQLAFSPWRLLMLTGITPEEGISVGAEEGIDDRSVRRYTRGGRRVVDPVNIIPTFQGQFPWLADSEFQWFRTSMRLRGATYPWFLALDPKIDSGTVWGGEDGIFYGDMEKSSRLSYVDGAYAFNVALVSIDRAG